MKHIEDSEQMAFFEQLDLQFPVISQVTFAIPNSGRSAAHGAKFKKLGVRAGMPDVLVCVRKELSNGLFIEFKRPATLGRPKGSLSKIQKLRMLWLESYGYKCVVAYGAEHGISLLKQYLAGTLTNVDKASKD